MSITDTRGALSYLKQHIQPLIHHDDDDVAVKLAGSVFANKKGWYGAVIINIYQEIISN